MGEEGWDIVVVEGEEGRGGGSGAVTVRGKIRMQYSCCYFLDRMQAYQYFISHEAAVIPS